MPALRKVAIAWAGVQTIGSLSLNDVLRTRARRFERKNARSAHGSAGWLRAARVAHARFRPCGSRPACVRHAPLLLDRRTACRGWPDAARLRTIRRRVRQAHWARTAENLAVLDHAIEDGPCIGPARIGKQRPVAEGARPELHAALKPPDDIAVGDHVGGFAGGILAPPRHQTGLLDGAQDLSLVELRTEIRGCAARPRLRSAFGAIDSQSCTGRGARIMRRGRNEDLRVGVCLPDQLVGDAIQRDAPDNHRRSALTERLSRRRRATTAASVTSCSVAAKSMCRGESPPLLSGPAQAGARPRRIEGREAERAKVHLIALLTHLNDRRQLLPIDVGIAVGGEAHDLGGVVHREAEINARLLPQEFQGVRIRERLDGFDPQPSPRASVEQAASPMPSMTRIAAGSKPDG